MSARRDLVIRLLAEVLAGLQVPASIGGVALLGAADEPWRRLRNHDLLNLHGYPDAKEHMEALRAVLDEAEPPYTDGSSPWERGEQG